MSVARDRVRRCRRRELDGHAAGQGCASLSRLRGIEHLHGGGLPEESDASGGRRRSHLTMATITQPIPAREEPRRPNIATADVQLPAVRDYEQVDREIVGTLHPTVAWFIGLGVALFFLLIVSAPWMSQLYSGLGAAGYTPPVMWGVYIITFVFWVGIGHAGTLISAILYLFRAGFRTTIYRCAEAMTVFAV